MTLDAETGQEVSRGDLVKGFAFKRRREACSPRSGTDARVSTRNGDMVVTGYTSPA